MCVYNCIYTRTYGYGMYVRKVCIYVHILSFTHALLCLEQPNHS